MCLSVCVYVGCLMMMMVVWILEAKRHHLQNSEVGWIWAYRSARRERERPLHPHAAYKLSSCFFARACITPHDVPCVVKLIWSRRRRVVCVCGAGIDGLQMVSTPVFCMYALAGPAAAAVSERVPLQRCRVSKGRSLNPPTLRPQAFLLHPHPPLLHCLGYSRCRRA